MNYTFLNNVETEQKVWSNGLLPSRAYFIPSSGYGICRRFNAENAVRLSDRVFSLSGEWDYAVMGGEIKFDSDSAMKPIMIPSALEYQRILPYEYGNSDGKEPTYTVFKRKFDVFDVSKMHTVMFNKVSGAFEVYVNGGFCGNSHYGYGEFDITKFIVKGANEILVRVVKNVFSDKFDNIEKPTETGITGDVLLILRAETYLKDYKFECSGNEINYEGKLLAQVKLAKKTVVEIVIYDGIEIIEHEAFIPEEDGLVEFNFSGEYKTYSAETPYLYDAYIAIFEKGVETECTHLKIGFSNKKCENGIFYCGDINVKLRGVKYRSGHNPDGTGMNLADYRDELSILKNFNVNAIYVKDAMEPGFAELCKEIGLYLIKEFPVNVEIPEPEPKKYKKNQEPPKFITEEINAFIKNRIYSLYERDKSNVNIIGYAFGKIPSEVEFANEISEFADYCNKPVINEENGFTYIESNNPQIIADGISESTKPVIITVSANERIDEYMNLVLGEDKLAGMFINEFKTVYGAETSVLFDANRVATDYGVLCRYAYKPFLARLADNRTLILTSLYDYKDTSDLVFTLIKRKGDLEFKLKDVKIIINPKGAREVNVYMGEIVPNMKLLVRCMTASGSHVATEVIKVEEEKDFPEYVHALTAKNYVYKVVNTEFNLEKLSENVMPARSHFVPCSGEAVSDSCDYDKLASFSDRVFSLSGEWDFVYFDGTVPAPIEFSSEGTEWKEISLPSSWESLGYEKLRYFEGYPFKTNLKKYVIEDSENNKNTVGIYRKIINIGDTSFRHFVCFEKVNGSLEIQVNGQYVGYTMIGQGEFDITDYITLGENELVVIVKKWTPAAFLNGKDGYSASGIVGEVYLTKSRACGLRNYIIETQKEGSDYIADMRFDFEKPADKVKIEIKRNGRLLFEKSYTDYNDEVTLAISGTFIGYNEESHELYDIYVKIFEKTFVTECTKIKFGFNAVHIVSDIIYYNDVPLKVRGITYNPIYNAEGKILTHEEVRRDLRLIKEYGFNTVRPLYAVSSDFITYCEKIGLYVIAGWGVNTDGSAKLNDKQENVITNNNMFAEIIQKTIEYSFERDKNASNIIMYIIPEDGNACCIADGIKWIEKQTTKPVMAYGNVGDILCARNPGVNDAIDIINEGMKKKPVFFAEYALGNGIGCATMHEFDDIINNFECCAGGCVADFVDDVVCGKGKKATGIFTADRKPYSGAENIIYIYRKVRSELVGEGEAIEITNYNSFISTSNIYVDLCIMRNGKILSRTRIYMTIPAGEKGRYDVFQGHIEGDMFLNVEYHDKETGRLLYTEQHRLNESLQKFEFPKERKVLDINEIFDYLDITFDCGCVRFNKKLGAIVRYNIMGKDILKADSAFKGGNCFVNNIYRPFIRNLKKEYPTFENKVRDFVCEYTRQDKLRQVHVNIENLIYINGKESYIVQDKYIVSAGGNIEVFSVITPLRRGLPSMDCFGKQLRLNNAFGNVYYYGNGGMDNYIDMCEHTTVGIYEHNVDKAFELMPIMQECGNRTNVSYTVVRDRDGDGILIAARKVPYQLRISPNSDKEIYDSYKLGIKPEQSGVYVDVNAFVCGIGDEKDGPLPKFTVSAGEHVLHFDIIPIKK